MTDAKPDILVTWPKSRPLGSYLAELELAQRDGKVINYRVRNAPVPTPERCYIVHDGRIMGWSPVLNVVHRSDGEVRRISGGYWPAGWYVVRRPEWNVVSRQIEQSGFRGWRWFDRARVA